MLPELASFIESNVLTPAAESFGLSIDKISSLGGFENYIAETELDGRPVVFRVSHPDRRTLNEIRAELEFIDYLAQHEVEVCRPIHSPRGELFEIVETPRSSFVISCFEKAPGRLVKRDEMTADHLANRGRALGALHFHARSFKPSTDQIKRIAWYEEEDFAHAREILPAKEIVVADRLEEPIEQLNGYERTNDTWGLCHFDAHHGNILFDGTKPTLIDFDDAAYELFVADLAIPLFYHILMIEDPAEQTRQIEKYLTHVLTGYQERYELDPRWPELFPLILRRREMVLYVAIHRGMDMNNLDDWCTRYMAGRKERIVARQPFTDYDFRSFAERLNRQA